MDPEEFSNKDREQQVRHVLNKKFNTIKGNNKKEWNDIMEESTNRSRRVSRRTRFVSAAAAAAVIIAITGGVLVVANNGGTKDSIKTVDKKKKDPVATSTTTTPAKTESILSNSYILKEVPITTLEKDGYYSYSYDVIDGQTGKVIKSLSHRDPSDGTGSSNIVLNYSGGTFSVARNPECAISLPGNFTYNPETGTITETGVVERVYSPNQKKYLEIDHTCGNDTNDLADNSSIGTIVLVDEDSGKRKDLPCETRSDLPNRPVECIIQAKWIGNDSLAIHTTSFSGARDIKDSWKIADLTKNVSLKDAPLLSEKIPGMTVNDGVALPDNMKELTDIRTFGNRTYALLVNRPTNATNKYPLTIDVIDITANEVLWTYVIDGSMGYGPGACLLFGSTPDIILGSTYADLKQQAWIFNHLNSQFDLVEGSVIVPKR